MDENFKKEYMLDFPGENSAEEIKPEEPVDFLKYYVAPHGKKSREVTEDDMSRVINDSHIMYNLCFTQAGKYPGGYAVAHPQINDTDPLRFFTTAKTEVVINPVIIRHTEFAEPKLEGCLSFADRERILVPRFYKVTVKYQTLTHDGKLSDVRTIELKGIFAEIFQHELDHFEGIYVYKD